MVFRFICVDFRADTCVSDAAKHYTTANKTMTWKIGKGRLHLALRRMFCTRCQTGEAREMKKGELVIEIVDRRVVTMRTRGSSRRFNAIKDFPDLLDTLQKKYERRERWVEHA
jgi:hypothetical protein